MHREHEVTSAPQAIQAIDGLRRGLAQGLKKGRQEGLRQALLTVYRARFGAVPVEVASVIEGTREIARLERWLEQIGAGSADDFTAALRA
jgi:hypothetical protein